MSEHEHRLIDIQAPMPLPMIRASGFPCPCCGIEITTRLWCGCDLSGLCSNCGYCDKHCKCKSKKKEV